MADTLTLDRVIELAVARGPSVRLIGDDRQLAAIGAGGVLRDIAATHGAVRLDELVRFADPAEAEASLDAARGRPGRAGVLPRQRPRPRRRRRHLRRRRLRRVAARTCRRARLPDARADPGAGA